MSEVKKVQQRESYGNALAEAVKTSQTSRAGCCDACQRY